MDQLILRAQDGAQAGITAHGAHVCSWIPAAGKEQLFLSKTSEFRDGAAIRGGVPVIFPQFAGLGSLP
ncbi:MAG: D-hexose-6-phosphate mutarotase, partial [Pseudomonadota bacterium]